MVAVPDDYTQTEADVALDAFSFSNHLAWQIGGPVIMHDLEWGTFAYSTLNQPIDDTRRATILHRSCPEDAFFDDVHVMAMENFRTTPDPFWMEAVPGVQSRRLVCPVFLSGVLVASIWVAETAGPLHPEAEQIVASAAKQASMFFQVHQESRRREAEVFLGMLLDGADDPAFLGQYLALPADARFRVLAVAPEDGVQVSGADLSSVVGVLRAAQVRSMGIVRGDRMLVLMFARPQQQFAPQALPEVLQELSRHHPGWWFAAGTSVPDVRMVSQSRVEAEDTLEYLMGAHRGQAATVGEVKSGVILMRLAREMDRQRRIAPSALEGLRRLEPADRAEAIATLDAYFDHRGNAAECARALHLHPNTFRYRLAKIADVLGIDLTDRDTRMLVQLDMLRERYGAD